MPYFNSNTSHVSNITPPLVIGVLLTQGDPFDVGMFLGAPFVPIDAIFAWKSGIFWSRVYTCVYIVYFYDNMMQLACLNSLLCA